MREVENTMVDMMRLIVILDTFEITRVTFLLRNIGVLSGDSPIIMWCGNSTYTKSI